MKDKLLQIINHYGIDKQIPIWIEEMSELTKELCKYQRTGKFTDNTKLEITDVQICLDEMKLALNYSLEEQKKNYTFKLDRTLVRMKDESK